MPAIIDFEEYDNEKLLEEYNEHLLNRHYKPKKYRKYDQFRDEILRRMDS